MGLDRFYFDTMIHDENALRFLHAIAGPDRVVFGSDAPFPMGVVEPGAALKVLESVMGPNAETQLRENAIAFMNCGCTTHTEEEVKKG